MIFVILGISVLVASFIIALISLIREQGKLSEQAGVGEAKNALVVNDYKTSNAKEPDEIAVPEAMPAGRVLFPWEEGKYQRNDDSTEADREKVEMLKAKLANLKTLAAKQDQAGREDKIVQTDAKADLGSQRLSGEISLSDLKRG